MNDIKDNTLIIVPSYLKEKVLLNLNNGLKDVKVMTLDSFIDSFLFTYDEKTIFYLMSNYNLKYDLALIYLNNLKFIENKNYISQKLNNLVRLKNHLDKEKLLIYNTFFKETLKRKNIVFYEIEQNKFNQNLINRVKEITQVMIINSDVDNNYAHNIYQFKDCDDELEFVAENICELLNNGVEANNIVLLNIGKDYLFALNRIFKMYNIPINAPNKSTLLSTKMVSFFLDNIYSDIYQTFERINQNFDLNNLDNLDIYNKLISICNKYNWSDNYLLVKDLLIHDLKNTRIKVDKISRAVRVENFEEYQPMDTDYVFLVGFNQGIIPILERDENYINDAIKDEVNIDKTVEKNSFHSKKSLGIIRNTKNMWISYIKNSKNGELQLSTLNNILNYPVIHSNKKYEFSNLNNLLTLGKELDNYLAYGTKTSQLNNLYSNYLT